MGNPTKPLDHSIPTLAKHFGDAQFCNSPDKTDTDLSASCLRRKVTVWSSASNDRFLAIGVRIWSGIEEF
jgi:hypothetical protein